MPWLWSVDLGPRVNGLRRRWRWIWDRRARQQGGVRVWQRNERRGGACERGAAVAGVLT